MAVENATGEEESVEVQGDVVRLANEGTLREIIERNR